MKILSQIEQPPRALTENQKKCLKFMISYFSITGEKPGLKTISEYMGWSTINSADLMVKALLKKKVLLPGENGKSWRLPFAKHPCETIIEELFQAIENEDGDLYAKCKSKYESFLATRRAMDRI